MRRCRVVVRAYCSIGQSGNHVESLGWRQCGRRELIAGLAKSDYAVQPNNVIVVVGELRMVWSMRTGDVRLQVPVDGGVGMVGVGLVCMLRRYHRRERDVGRQYQADDSPAERARHVEMIMVG